MFIFQVFLIGDCTGGIIAYDALCRTTAHQGRHGSTASMQDEASPTLVSPQEEGDEDGAKPQKQYGNHLSAGLSVSRQSSNSSIGEGFLQRHEAFLLI